jgi:AAA15 family ATPase/GTPase
MIIESVQISNFRSIQKETLFCDELTALVGPNGSGKSTFLRALDLFTRPHHASTRRISTAGNTKEPITSRSNIEIFPPPAKEKFSRYMQARH